MQGAEGQEPHRAPPRHRVSPGLHQHQDFASLHRCDGLAAGRVDGGCAGLRGLSAVSALVSPSSPASAGLIIFLSYCTIY
jgi:hypothetical protein